MIYLKSILAGTAAFIATVIISSAIALAHWCAFYSLR
jgi:hypothetical protein